MSESNDGQKQYNEAANKALAVATELLNSVNEIRSGLNGLQRSKASKRTVFLLTVSIVIDVLLSIALVVIAIDQSASSAAIRNSNLSQCLQNNIARAEDKVAETRITDFELGLLVDLAPPGTKLTPKIAAEVKVLNEDIASARSLIASKDTPRDCNKIFHSSLSQ